LFLLRITLLLLFRVVPPGMTVRKSIRVVFLRFGQSDLNRFALFDSLSRTCFLPSGLTAPDVASAASSPSTVATSATAWEVFLRN
jgi:hypothetical protein